MLVISDLTIRIAGRPLIERANVSIPTGAKTGLVGRNGTGKTTLFRAITGELQPDEGKIVTARGMRIGGVAQEAPGTEDSLIDIVLAADVERADLFARAETATDPEDIADIHTRLVDIDAHSGEARAAAILAGLGFDAEAQGRPASAFSGGWRMRVALAAVLFARPDILLLDEPTNYLDLEGALWLENFIARYAGTVLIVSHDRDLLNTAANSILHLDNRSLAFYRGDFDSFARQRAQAAELAAKFAAKQDARRKHLQSFIDRFRAKASKARQAQSRIKMLEKMQPVAAATESAVAPFRFPAPEKMPASPIIRLEGVDAGYAEGRPILRNLHLRIDHDDRIALLGANGNGKSTFAKLIDGRLPYVTGETIKAPGLKVALFAQHQLDDLIPEETPVGHVRPLMPGQPESKIRARVAQMGLDTARMDTKAADLSGGEKARLLLGLVAFAGPHLLILDEPTNHLDMESREALMMALNDFPGAVILISHDRNLVEATADRLWLVRDGTVRPYDGDIADYRNEVLSGGAQKRAKAGRSDNSARGGGPKRTNRMPLQKRVLEIEAEMDRLQGDIAKADRELADPEIFALDPAGAARLSRSRAALQQQLEKAEESWLAASASLEAAE
jgi:ATP-binding cassette subfamily F protein 3